MIYTFQPIFKSTIWGGERIKEFKQVITDQQSIGESWELSGVPGDVSVIADGPDTGLSLVQLIERDGAKLLGEANYERFGLEFPLLIKFIDATDDLSIQVHPNDETALERHNSKGKTEMWYVVDGTPDAHLRVGFSKQTTADEYCRSVEDNTICNLLADYNVKAGDVFFLPAGRVHSIGAGCFIAEIQQTSNITYRIYDFDRRDAQGNARELHTELAKDVIDYDVLPDYKTDYTPAMNEAVELVECPYFTTNVIEADEEMLLDWADEDSFMILIVMEGSATVTDNEGNSLTAQAGQTLLLPATTQFVTILPDPNVKLLQTYIG